MFESIKNSLFLKQAINKYKAILKQYIKRQLLRFGKKNIQVEFIATDLPFKQKFYDWSLKSVSCLLGED